MTQTARVSLLIGVATVSVLALWWWRKKTSKKYLRVGRVKKIFFHPIKSLRGIEVSKARCNHGSLEVNSLDDRSYMLISGNGVLISLREEPSLALLTVSFNGNELVISGPEMEPLTINAKEDLTSSKTINWRETIDVEIHGDKGQGAYCGDVPASWFQKYLKRQDVRLVRTILKSDQREFKRKPLQFRHLFLNNPTTFQDCSSFHLLSEPSIDDLNTRLQDKVSVRNFRPNLLVDGCNPYDEDNWKYIKFSSGAEILHLSGCGRCLLTTVNPETGVKTNVDPVKTLRTYRMPLGEELKAKTTNTPCLGVLCRLFQEGDVSVGDEIFAIHDYNLVTVKSFSSS